MARELGTPVALVSATTGAGLEAVTNFLSASSPAPEPLELPVVGSTRSVREWAVRVGENSSTVAPRHPFGRHGSTTFFCTGYGGR